MKLEDYIRLVTQQLGERTDSIILTVGLDERGRVNTNSRTTVTFTLAATPSKEQS